MDDRCIALYDSGVGGFSLLSALYKLYPKENFAYFCDYKNFPYGDKKRDEIVRLCNEKTKSILSFSPKAIIFACNTLSTATLDSYSNFPVKVFGIRPTVKKGEKTLVISTVSTAKSEYVKNLKKEYDFDILPAAGLAEEVESWVRGGEKPNTEKLFKGVRRDYEAIVLGCTHYALIKKEFETAFPKSIVYDGLSEVLGKIKGWLPTNDAGRDRGEIIFTSDDDKRCFFNLYGGF